MVILLVVKKLKWILLALFLTIIAVAAVDALIPVLFPGTGFDLVRVRYQKGVPRPRETSVTTVAPLAPSEGQAYVHESPKFQLVLPAGWLKQPLPSSIGDPEPNQGFQFVPPQLDVQRRVRSLPSILVVAGDFPGLDTERVARSNVGLEQATLPQYKLLKFERTTLPSGVQGFISEASFLSDGISVREKALQVWESGILYYIKAISTADKWETYSRLFDGVLTSFSR